MTGRRSKICCTLDPATSSPDAIRALVDAGMDAARLNFSHGTHADHAILTNTVLVHELASAPLVAPAW